MGKYFGTTQELIFRETEDKESLEEELTLTYQEFLKMGKPRKIQETRTYEPLIEGKEK